jgi:type II secretory pathway component PulC
MMSKSPKRSLLPSLMASAGLVLACIIYAEVRNRPTMQRDVSPHATTWEVRASQPTQRQAMPEKARFSAIVERPLFLPSRRPPSEEAVAASTPTPDFSLFGVVISTGEPFALVTPETGGDPIRVKQGEEISGWTVDRIESDRILIRQGRTESELLLDFTAPAPPPTETAMPTDAHAGADEQANQQGTGGDGGQTADTGEAAPEAQQPAPADQSTAPQ